MPVPANAELTAGTNTGRQLNAINTTCMSDADAAEWAKVLPEIEYPWAPDTNQDGTMSATELDRWQACAYYDFNGNARDNAPNQGAFEYAD
jgi:hypothetical protein